MTDSCDDPYKILALNLVANCSNAELHKMLHESKAVKRRIVQEVNEADFYGPFLDCILVSIARTNERRKIEHTLVETANFFYSKLDLPRLRAEIKNYCAKFERDVE